MKFKTLLICCFIIANLAHAQESSDSTKSKWKVNVAADLMSRYIWRGLDYGASPNIQPTLALRKGNFEVGYWGAISILGTYSEVDLYAKYSYKNFSAIVTDYFFPIDGVPTNNYQKYFNYNSDNTNHLAEVVLQYKGGEKFPLSLLAGTIVYGNDKDSLYNNRYSTYLEAGYSFKFSENNVDMFVGLTPHEGLYGSDLRIVNIGITGYRNIEITDKFSLPVKASIIINPHVDNIYFAFGITF
ncbi:MAG: hypothetical protein A2046_01470 [Bacteroidetes bacterium GWA2_30_7]|nr:MAG: hypothetical protein A2046_01470 [Bacteroidetes bacterium GWA2_30_7]